MKLGAEIRLALIGLLLLAGCQAYQDDPLTRVGVNIVVSQGTARYIQSGEDWEARAQRWVSGGQVALAAASGEAVRLADIQAALDDHVNWNRLTPADEALLRDVISAVSAAVTAQIADGDLDGDALTTLRELIAVSVETARLYVED